MWVEPLWQLCSVSIFQWKRSPSLQCWRGAVQGLNASVSIGRCNSWFKSQRLVAGSQATKGTPTGGEAVQVRIHEGSHSFLGHIIAGDGFHPTEEKVTTMSQWLIPTKVKMLRGFLGLTSYYRRFIHAYVGVAALMTDLLKHDTFVWSREAQESFDELKLAMVHASILSHLDFSKTFVVESNAYHSAVGAMLMQDDHPITFYSCKLQCWFLLTSTYSKNS